MGNRGFSRVPAKAVTGGWKSDWKARHGSYNRIERCWRRTEVVGQAARHPHRGACQRGAWVALTPCTTVNNAAQVEAVVGANPTLTLGQTFTEAQKAVGAKALATHLQKLQEQLQVAADNEAGSGARAQRSALCTHLHKALGSALDQAVAKVGRCVAVRARARASASACVCLSVPVS